MTISTGTLGIIKVSEIEEFNKLLTMDDENDINSDNDADDVDVILSGKILSPVQQQSWRQLALYHYCGGCMIFLCKF